MKRIIKDDKGQIIVILAVIISILLASLSLLYAQNILAGNESAYSQLSSSSHEIENLRDMIDELKKIAEDNANNPEAFMRYADALNEQVKALYASHGSYADIEVYNVSLNSNGDIKSFNVRIVFSNPEIDYEEVQFVPV
jgi:hypothetical protein